MPLGAFGLFAIVTSLAAGAWDAHLMLAALTTAIAWLIVGLSIAELLHHRDSLQLWGSSAN